MNSLKQEAIQLLSTLPENVSIDEMMYRLYVLDNIRNAETEEKQGKIISLKKVKQEIEKW